MSGLARILVGNGNTVSGSDLASSYVTEALLKAGAQVYIGHDARYVQPHTTVVYSSDIKLDNPEYLEAKRLNCPLLHRSDLLLQLMDKQKVLAVAGTHGKTTTTSLLISTLLEGGLDPSFAVGGMVTQLQTNAEAGSGEYFVAEADESDGTFLKYRSFGAIITNIDLDHMNHFITEEALLKAFDQFARTVSSEKHLFWCGDDPRLQSLGLPGISYGFSPASQLRVLQAKQIGWGVEMDIDFKGTRYSKVEVSLIGRHNILNALAVFGLSLSVGVKEEPLRKALKTFQGVKRRCDKKGEVKNILVLDDYAHHPTEIKTTLEGIRQAIGNRRLVAVFQPHRYSRTQDCLGSYGGIFNSADELFMTDIFAAGETPIPDVTNEKVMTDIKSQKYPSCQFVGRKELTAALLKFLRPFDVVVTLGAGDITKIGSELITSLAGPELTG